MQFAYLLSFFKTWKYYSSRLIGNDIFRYSAKLGLEPGCAEFPKCVLRADLEKRRVRRKRRKSKLKSESCCFGTEKELQSRHLFPKRRRGSVTHVLVTQCFQVALGNYCHLGTFRVVWWMLVMEQPFAAPESLLPLSWHVTSFALLWGLSQE